LCFEQNHPHRRWVPPTAATPAHCLNAASSPTRSGCAHTPFLFKQEGARPCCC
jgi:hypothetical protein